MESVSQRTFWQSPWGYAQSLVVVAGILLIGFLLQILIGSFSFYLLAFPVNIIVGIVILLSCLLAGWRFRNSWPVQWFSGQSMSVCLIVALLLLSLIMGLIPQLGEEHPSHTFLGWETMTRNWAFVFIYLLTLLSLGILIVRRLISFRWRDYAFYLNHMGLWLLLMASGLGYADMERYVMHVYEGDTERRVYGSDEQVKELPIAIELKDYRMDVYQPRLALIDRRTGEVLPAGSPEYFPIDLDNTEGHLGGYGIRLQQYIHQAIRNSDSTYREVPMPGSSPAALIQVRFNGRPMEGWVCAGNRAQLYQPLTLDSLLAVVMTPPEPRSFTSDVVVYTRGGDTQSATLSVNHPVSTGAWTIYQYGYDENAGALSAYSSFELVYDPWLWPVYVGVWMMMVGSACLIWQGRKRKELTNDVE